jgi:hypothetical protein
VHSFVEFERRKNKKLDYDTMLYAIENLGVVNGTYSNSMNLKEFGAGVYLMQLQIGNRLLSKKIIVR